MRLRDLDFVHNIQTLLVEFVKQLERSLEQFAPETKYLSKLLIRYSSKEPDHNSIRKDCCEEVSAGAS